MIYKKINLFIQSAVFTALLIVVSATAFKQPAWILKGASISFIFGFLFVLLGILPFGQQVLGDREKRLPFKKYLGLLLAGQSALLILSLTTALAFVGVGPKFTEGFIVIGEVQSLIKHEYLTSWGVFPWALFGLWGVMIAYIGYSKQDYPLVGNIARLSFKKNIFEPAVKGFSEYIIFAASLFCFLFSLVAAILLLSYMLELMLGFHSHLFVHFITLIILSFVPSLFFFTKRNKQFLKLSKNLNLTQLLWCLIGVMVLILVFCAFLGNWCLGHLSNQALQLQGNCAQYFEHISIQTKIASLFWGWWLLWVPLAGSFIARFSVGRTVREVVVGVLFAPVVLLICYIGLAKQFDLSDVLYYFNYSSYSNYFQAITYLICSAFTLGIVFWMIHGLKNNIFFYAGFMSLPHPLKTSRIDLRWAPKLFGPRKLLKVLAIGIISIIVVHTLGGWFMIAFQFLALGTFIMFILSIGSIGFVLHLLKASILDPV